MTPILTIDAPHGIRLYLTAIDGEGASAPQNRREREKEAVLRLLTAVFGTSATLRHKADGAPYIDDSAHPGIHISISHSTTHALLAVAHHVIGVDIDHQRPTLQRVATRFLSPAEQAFVGDDLPTLLKAWTAKEAIFKASALHPADFAAQIDLSPILDAATVTTSSATESHTIIHLPAPDAQSIAIAIPQQP